MIKSIDEYKIHQNFNNPSEAQQKIYIFGQYNCLSQLIEQMNRTQQQWTRLQEQIKKLRKQNQDLKRLLQLEVNHSPLQSIRRQFQSTKFPHLQPQKQFQTSINPDELKKQWAQWSNRLEASIVLKNNRIRHTTTEADDLKRSRNLSGEQQNNQKFFTRKSLQSLKSVGSSQSITIDIKTPVKSQMVLAQNLSLIEDIFLFGPSINDIQKSVQRKFIASHQLYFPQSQKPDFEIYGNYLFPKQLQVKHIREKNHNVELNKIIFKNNKKLDCNIFIFYQDKLSNQKLQRSNKLLEKVNPSKWMYALSIEFSDFVTAVNENVSASANNKTFTGGSEHGEKNDRFLQGDRVREKEMGGTSSSKKTIITQQQIFRSNFCLCIMTYFPFIRFLKDILIEVFDSVKLRRMNKYSNCTSYKQIDINYFIQELKVQLSKFLEQKLKVQAQMNKIYEFPINEVGMRLDLSEGNLINQMIGDWGFKILKQLDKDTLLDVFCYIMLQQSVCFICQDKSILTFIILLYIVVFSLPFGYPHPCISIVFNDQLLDSPFIGVLGINQSSKWTQQNLQWLTGNKQNKLLVNLNQDQVKIKFKKKPRTHKSQRLKKIFHNFYRKIETSSIPSIFKKKMELITRETTKQENQHVAQLFTELHNYYQQQLFAHLPNPQIIELIKQSYISSSRNLQEGYNPNLMYNAVVGKIERYLAESRRSKNKEGKDPFIDELVKKQLFWLYMDEMYQLK